MRPQSARQVLRARVDEEIAAYVGKLGDPRAHALVIVDQALTRVRAERLKGRRIGQAAREIYRAEELLVRVRRRMLEGRS